MAAGRWVMAGAVVTLCVIVQMLAVPQGRAQDRAVPVVGDLPPPDQTRPVDNPGIYGLGPDLPGSRYAVVSGHLVRLDSASGRILSVLRPVPTR